MAAKIPVTVITGFLGSGKTTLIREQLQNNQGRRIAVLVNEFGEIGIDGDLLRSCRVCDEDGKECVSGSRHKMCLSAKKNKYSLCVNLLTSLNPFY